MATLLRLLAVLVLVTAAAAFLRRPKYIKETRPEMWMDTMQLIKRQGFEAESHHIETSDGYKLVLHRIPRSRNGTQGGLPIMVGHGLGSCSEQWVTRGPGALVFQLAEKGYDIWLANYRGSFYGRKHKTYNVKDKDFWDFSWHENGVIDHAESIDYILKVTGHEDLISVGHSMSSSASVVMLAERPEYNKKVRGQILLAPPILFNHPKGFMAYSGRTLSILPGAKAATATYVDNDPFPGLDRPFPGACFKDFGGFKPKLSDFCRRVIQFVMGNLHEPSDPYQLQLIMHHYPAGTSIRQVLHYGQSVGTTNFRKYDFGRERNLELYGTKTPTDYNLTNIVSPTWVVMSRGDATVDWNDANDFADRLRPTTLKARFTIPARDYCHIDYLIAKDAEEILYPTIIEFVDAIKNL